VFQAGLFNEPINNNTFIHTGWQASIRGVYSPMLGSTRLHLGANFQHRQNTREALAQQYRSRPLTQLTDQRFIDTGNIASRGDDVAGLEFAAIHNSLHFAAEAQKVWVRHAYDAAEIATLNALGNTNDTIPAGAVALNGSPSFWGAYAELGYYLTGETRGYKGGKWDRTKVLHPFNDGGWGALQLNGRVDYLDLTDRVGGTPLVTAGYASGSTSQFVNGGKQLGYQASLIWNPMDYLRFMAQLGRVDISGGPRAATVNPTGLSSPSRKYHVNTAAVRAQLEF